MEHLVKCIQSLLAFPGTVLSELEALGTAAALRQRSWNADSTVQFKCFSMDFSFVRNSTSNFCVF